MSKSSGDTNPSCAAFTAGSFGSAVGVTFYADKQGEGKSDVTVAALAKVDDGPAFLDEAARFIKKGWFHGKDADLVETELKIEEKRIADRPARLIRIPWGKKEKGKDKS